MGGERSIRVEIEVAAPVERAWAAWTDPDRLVEWFPDRASGEARPGGAMTYAWDALGAELALDVVEAAPPRRLVLRANGPDGSAQTQTVELAAHGDRTRVTMEHAGFGDGPEQEDVFHGTASGWHVTMQLCKLYLERHFGEPRASAWILGLAPATFERLFPYYTERDRLARWLGDARGGIGDVGGRYRIALADGDGLVASGAVLARCAPREVALGWDELRGAIAFRAFTVAAGAKLVGVQVASWGIDQARLAPVGEALERAVDRLVRELGGAGARA
jgi:uncharacterized protein YndB with AHSA1/START domain